ncbi:MAG: hypothetical protein HND57_05665 [Planctomycetes bacterium]|nr:hypothetical protein [Planctomycetota bacterium]
MDVRHLPTYRVLSSARLIDVLIVSAVGAALVLALPGCGGNRARNRLQARQQDNDIATTSEAADTPDETGSAADTESGISADYEDIGLDLDSLKADLEYVNNSHQSNEGTSTGPSQQAMKTASTGGQRQPIQWTQPDRADDSVTEMSASDTDGLAGAAMQAMQVGDESGLADPPTDVTGTQNTMRKQDPTGSPSFTTSELIVLLSSRLAQERSFAENDRLRYDLANAALLMIDPNRQIDTSNLYDLSDEERDIVSAYQQHFLELNSQLGSLADPQSLAQSTRTLADALKPEDTLRLSNLKLCTAVMNFGNYTELDTARFLRGRRQEVIVYIEVEGFTSTYASQDDLHHTTLTEQVDLYTAADGVVVYSLPAETVRDTCRRTRRDFYLVRRLVIPANLSLGDYRLKVRVRDESNAYESEAVLPFEVVADPALVRANR